MLILSRQRTQQLLIGNDVTVTVVDIRHGRVYLGIEAPDEVKVDRLELRVAKLQAANNEVQ